MSWAFLLMSAVPSALSPAAPIFDPDLPGLLVTVGEVAADRATLWVRSDDAAPVAVRLEPEGQATGRSLEVPIDPERDRTGRVVLDALAPATRYRYEVGVGPGRVHGTFRTAPAPAADARVHLLWSADLGGFGHCRDVEDGYPIFRAMAARAPDLFLFVGDTVYADRLCGPVPHAAGADFVAGTLEEFHRKHRYNRADPGLQHFFRRAAVYATWDDHEVRNNFAGTVEPLMPVGRRAFLDYWPIAPPPEEPGRLYRSVRWGRHVEILILDTRQYRTANGAADGPDKTMLGAAQRGWLLDRLLTSDATWKLVVSSVPLGMFTGGTHADGWSDTNLFGYPRRSREGFVTERDLILRTLRERAVRNVVFVSGDVHHAELIRHDLAAGYAIHEFVAGPLSARQGFPRFLDRSLQSRSLASVGFTNNFGEIVADGDALHVRIRDTSGAARASVRVPATP
jgi:alkaline phosphatase D